MTEITIAGHDLNLNNVWAVAYDNAIVHLADTVIVKMQDSRKYIENQIKNNVTIYGVNTGFGAFASVRISTDQIKQLQLNLIRSHAVGVGDSFEPQHIRAMMLLRAATLANAHSGVRPQVVQKILEFLNHNITPYVPMQGSVGASGDLAPLAHIALALIGEGYCIDAQKRRIETASLLSQKNISPLVPEAKEGLSLINGCQVMTAVGLLALKKAIDCVKLADCCAAMSLEGLKGSRAAFDPLISMVRPHPGELKTASNMRRLLGQTSEIGLSHLNCDRVQDPYSLRCIPAVHGAVKDTLHFIHKTLVTEANAVTDNPLVFHEANKILSCGNFHGMPVAFALDYGAIALTALGSISEQRLAKLINPAMSAGLPAFLAPAGGLNSGFMITHVVSASLVSENKVFAHPASCDSIPTSADKEDHVSMGTIAARKFDQIVRHSQWILANEFLASAQAIDLLRPLKSSQAIETMHALIRKYIRFADQDRWFGEDVEKMYSLIQSGQLLQSVEHDCPLEW